MHKIQSLQTIRAIAAIMVIIDHSLNQFSKYRTYTPFTDKIINNAKFLGDIGVIVFFIVSGWIMMMTTDGRVWNFSFAKSFICKRIIRVVPLYWFFLSLIVIMYISGLAFHDGYYSKEKIFFSYILIPYKQSFNDGINPILPQAWTLIYEIFFYFIFSLSISLGLKNKIIISMLSFFTLIITSTYFINYPESIKVFFSNPIFFIFTLGMLAYKLKVLGSHKTHIRALYFFIFLTSLILLLIKDLNKDIVFPLSVFSGVFLFLYLFVSKDQHKVFVFLGDASYSIYLIHIFFTLVLGTILRECSYDIYTDIILLLATIFLSIITGCFSFQFIEKPLIKYLTKKFI